jgi:hypothetical protein
MIYELRCAYTEVYKVLENMPQEYVNKIPNKIINLLETSKLENYETDIDKQNPIDRTKLSKQALTIIAMLNYQYWCPNSKVKKELYNNYLANEEKEKQELQEKYNSDNLFKSKITEDIKIEEETQALVEYKEKTFIQKIFDKIKRFFSNRKKK